MISEKQYEQSGLVEKLDSRALVSALRLGYLNIVYYVYISLFMNGSIDFASILDPFKGLFINDTRFF